MSFLARLRIEAEDQLRWHPAARTLLCRHTLRKARRLASGNSPAILQSIDQLCGAARLAPKAEVMQQIESLIRERIRSLDLANVDWREVVPNVERRRIEKSVVLKPYLGPKEKGVVFISFEDQWARLLWKCNVKEFSERYTLVISPTWSPPHNLVNCLFPVAYPAELFCLISSVNDLQTFPRLSKHCLMVPLYSSSWVDPSPYRPVPFEKKDLDIFMLANFGKYKRHFLLFKALREMPASVRVLLIGQNNGDRTRDSIMAEARAYGVQNRFELLVNVPDATVFDAFGRAKTTLILSRREGSCVAVAESMFANTPVGIFDNAEIGSRVFINEATGRFLEYRDLGRQLMDFIASADKYSPRAWAEKHISCFLSTRTLNDALKNHALATGQEWTQDIAVLQWRPNPRLVHDQDRERLQTAYEDIKTRFGLTFGEAIEPP
jgi:glycosyltransferase involved in cell wall biosynthesis